MAKYSTGGSSGGGDGDACELCGRESTSLTEANVAGAQLRVCPDCAPHDDTPSTRDTSSDTRDQEEQDRKKRAVRNSAKANDVWDSDSSHWEQEGTNYDDDPLPYLVSGYGEKIEEARQEAGLQRDELAGELGVDEAELLALEQGRATQAGIGGSLVEALEERLNVELSE